MISCHVLLNQTQKNPNKLLRQNGSLLCHLRKKQSSQDCSAFHASSFVFFLSNSIQQKCSPAAEADFVYHSKGHQGFKLKSPSYKTILTAVLLSAGFSVSLLFCRCPHDIYEGRAVNLWGGYVNMTLSMTGLSNHISPLWQTHMITHAAHDLSNSCTGHIMHLLCHVT